MKWRTVFLLALTAFAITLAIIIGQRLSSEALSILLGVVIGVAASLPSSLIIVWAMNRTSHPPPQPDPKIIIVPPAATSQPSLPAAPESWANSRPAPNTSPRQFVIIGGDEPADE